MRAARHKGMIAAALVAGLALGLGGAARAGDNHHHDNSGLWDLERADASEAAILQTGENNSVSIEQKAAAGFVQGYATSQMNEASVIQNGTGNEADLYQGGSSNDIDLTQAGNSNQAAIAQYGTQRQADVTQTGTGLSIGITQYGWGNSAPIVVHQQQ
jgi:hypothetical protein